jgi:hypothetical protein
MSASSLLSILKKSADNLRMFFRCEIVYNILGCPGVGLLRRINNSTGSGSLASLTPHPLLFSKIMERFLKCHFLFSVLKTHRDLGDVVAPSILPPQDLHPLLFSKIQRSTLPYALLFSFLEKQKQWVKAIMLWLRALSVIHMQKLSCRISQKPQCTVGMSACLLQR